MMASLVALIACDKPPVPVVDHDELAYLNEAPPVGVAQRPVAVALPPSEASESLKSAATRFTQWAPVHDFLDAEIQLGRIVNSDEAIACTGDGHLAVTRDAGRKTQDASLRRGARDAGRSKMMQVIGNDRKTHGTRDAGRGTQDAGRGTEKRDAGRGTRNAAK